MVGADIIIVTRWQGVIIASFTDDISLLQLAVIAVVHGTWVTFAIQFVVVTTACQALVEQGFTTRVEAKVTTSHVQDSVVLDARCFVIRHVIPFATLVAFGVYSFVDLTVLDKVLAFVVPFDIL